MKPLISNVEVCGLERSMVTSAYPMLTSTDGFNVDVENLKYWNKDDFLEKFVCEGCKYSNQEFIVLEDMIQLTITDKQKNTTNVYFDHDDLPIIFGENWSCNTYCKSTKRGLMHRMIVENLIGKLSDDIVVDHIDKNPLNNCKSNLRLCNKSQNGMNTNLSKNNKSGVTGVAKHKESGWRAYVNIPEGQVMKCFKDYNEAVKARLEMEKKYYGEFSPQIDMFEEYGIEKPEIKPVGSNRFDLVKAINDYKRMKKLACTKPGEGHDQALTGITVYFDLTCTNKMWVEAERYNYLEFISSQSTMHRITRMNLDDGAFSPYVLGDVKDMFKNIVETYNSATEQRADQEELKELYLTVLYNCPAGLRLTAGMVTNYRQLKTIYKQRKNHRLPEWREFCEWIKTLPHSEWITGE